MTEENYYDEYEIDLREYIMLLWEKKWFIIALFIIAVIAAGFYSTLMVEPTYRVESNLLILPPKYKTSLEVSTLPIDTYRNLAMTDSIKQKIIDELNLKNENGKKYTPGQLDNMMSIEVVAQEGEVRNNEQVEAPLLKLKVKGKDPQKITDIANTWADEFMADSKEIRKGEIREVAQVIENQYESTEEKLENLKERLLEFKKENRLEIARSELEVETKMLEKINNEIKNIQLELGRKESKLNELNNIIDSNNEGDHWAGEISRNIEVSNNNSLKSVKINYLEKKKELVEFKSNHNIELLKERISLEKEKIREYNSQLIELNKEMNAKKEENNQIKEIISKEPKNWVLNKSIDENSLWEKLLTPDQINAIKNIELENQIVNPIYEKLKEQLAENKVILKTVPMKIEKMKEMIVSSNENLNELNTKLNNWQNEIENIESDISLYKKMYKDEKNLYQNNKKEYIQIRNEIKILESELSYYTQKKDTSEKNIEDLQDHIWKAENTKETLTLRVENVKSTYNMLAKKVEEARISEAQKTSDVKFIARAVPPTQPVGGNLKLNVAIAGVLALMLGVFIVFFREFLKEDEEENYKA